MATTTMSGDQRVTGTNNNRLYRVIGVIAVLLIGLALYSMNRPANRSSDSTGVNSSMGSGTPPSTTTSPGNSGDMNNTGTTNTGTTTNSGTSGQ